jgi:predicted enzyme related to lactoylglutathione lyase
MASVKRINVVFLYVLNLEKERKFYEAAFDLGKPVVDAKWWVQYKLGDGSDLALHQVNPKHVGTAGLGHGSVKFSIEVDDIHHYTNRLEKLGAKFCFEPQQEYGFWLAEFEDPEGNALRLFQKIQK